MRLWLELPFPYRMCHKNSIQEWVEKSQPKGRQKHSCWTFCNCSEFCVLLCIGFLLRFFSVVVAGCHLVAGAFSYSLSLCVICPANRKQKLQSQFYLCKVKTRVVRPDDMTVYTINKPCKNVARESKNWP